MELHELTVHEAHELLKKKEITSEELINALFKRIENIDDKIKAYVTLDKEQALQVSHEVDQKADFKQPLSGIPVAVKDNICTEGLKTTCCSKMLQNFVPPYDATVLTKLKTMQFFRKDQYGRVCLGFFH